MGHDRAATAFLQCAAGRREVASGQLAVLGMSPRSRWRLRSRRLFVPAGDRAPSALGAKNRPDLVLLEDPALPSIESKNSLRRSLVGGMTIVMTTSKPDVAMALATHAILLARGRLIAAGPIPEVVGRFRRLQFVNGLTDTRTAFGTELDDFDALRVRVRGWGIEAVVSNFEESAFERLSGTDGVSDARADPMTLAEILEACHAKAG
jgi:hypothetical protein